jgi:hypothetical protein
VLVMEAEMFIWNIKEIMGIEGEGSFLCSLLKAGVSGFPFPRNENLLEKSCMCVLEHAQVFKHIFYFILSQGTMSFRVPRNENPHRIPRS